jgi:hypothetical protein
MQQKHITELYDEIFYEEKIIRNISSVKLKIILIVLEPHFSPAPHSFYNNYSSSNNANNFVLK